jgi:hypothetical protein
VRRREGDPVPRDGVGGEEPDLERLRVQAGLAADDPRFEREDDDRRLQA